MSDHGRMLGLHAVPGPDGPVEPPVAVFGLWLAPLVVRLAPLPLLVVTGLDELHDPVLAIIDRRRRRDQEP